MPDSVDDLYEVNDVGFQCKDNGRVFQIVEHPAIIL
jgi:hypothetical protein